MYSRGKNSKVQEKIGEISLLTIFFSTGPIFLAKGIICNNVQLSKIIFEKHLQFVTLYSVRPPESVSRSLLDPSGVRYYF